MRLRRIDKLQLLTWTCTKPTQGGKCIVGAFLVLGQATTKATKMQVPKEVFFKE
jgi:hypothetical protein